MTISRHETSPGRSVTDTALGLALVVAAAGRRTAHRTRVVWSPFVTLAGRAERTVRRTPLASALAAVAAQGEGLRRRITAGGEDALDRLLPAAVEEALRRVDLTQVVLRHVDLDRVVAEVDVDAVAARLHIVRVLDRLDLTDLAVKRLDWDVLVNAVLAHVDLEAVALEVIEAVDLPEIIRESSGALTSDTVRSARIRGAAADQALSRVRDRFRARHDGVGLPAPQPPVGS